MLGTLSALLRNLYRNARDASDDPAREAILRGIRESLPFDSALWASGTVRTGGPQIHEFTLLGQPPTMMAAYDSIKAVDLVHASSFERIGHTLNVDVFGATWQRVLPPEITAHCRRWGMAHILATCDTDLPAGLMFAFSLYRSDPNRPFSEAERALCEALTQHLPELDAIHRLHLVERRRREEHRARRVYAICDRHGYLRHADREFAPLVQSEWPAWKGPRLPDALSALIAATEAGEWRAGAAVVAQWEPQRELILVAVFRHSALDRLTARELSVAERFARGDGYPDIAHALGLAPATVRNHLRNIYAKLGIHSKVELAELLRNRSD